MDQLRQALSGHFTPSDPRSGGTPPSIDDLLPDPARSPWADALRGLSAALPARPTLGQLRQRSDALVKELKTSGRRRDSEALQKLRDSFEKEREKVAWSLIKESFDQHSLPERAWRALKQAPDAEPVAILQKIRKLGASLAGAGADRVRDALLGKQP